MSNYNYDDIFSSSENLSPDEKLANLRNEAKQIFFTLLPRAEMILDLVKERKAQEMPDDFEDRCAEVLQQIKMLQDLVEGLTDRQHRDVSRQQHEREMKLADRASHEQWWRRLQSKLPELQPYENIVQAIAQTAQRLVVPWDDNIREKNHKNADYTFVTLMGAERKVRVGIQVTTYKETGFFYFVKLEWLADQRNLDWREYTSLTHSLEDAIVVTSRWMFEQWTLAQIQKNYVWTQVRVVTESPSPRWMPEGWVDKGARIQPVQSAESHYGRKDGGVGWIQIFAVQSPWSSAALEDGQHIEINGQPAIYTDGHLSWIANSITYRIDYVGFPIEKNDLIRMAESL